MKRIAILIVIVATAICAWAQSVIESPVFSQPLTAISQADSVLTLPNTSPEDRLLAVLEYSTAKANIDPDSMYVLPRWIACQAEKETDISAKGLMQLYEAVVLNMIYSRRRYTYDSVDAPLLPLPENLEEWSGAQFKVEIKSLVESALTNIPVDNIEPLSRYDGIIDIAPISRAFYPNLRDFAYSIAINVMRGIDRDYADVLYDAILAATHPGSEEWAVWAAQQTSQLLTNYQKYPKGLVGAYFLSRLDYLPRYEDHLWAAEIDKYLKSNSWNDLSDGLKNIYEELTEPVVRISYPNIAAPEKSISLAIEAGYVGKISIKVYAAGDPLRAVYDKNPIASVEKTYDSSRHELNDAIELGGLKTGNYKVAVYVNDQVKAYDSSTLIVSQYLPYIVAQGDDNAIAMLEYQSGKPKKGIKLYLAAKNDDNLSYLGKTNGDGILRIADLENLDAYPSMLVAKNGEDTVYFDQSIYPNGDYDLQLQHSTSFLISRPLYHPGDSIHWSSVSIVKDFVTDNKPSANKDIVVRFFDANSQLVDTLSVQTDQYGRAHGAFKIPEDRLTGRYYLHCSIENYTSIQHVIVSDFKQPVMEVLDADVSVLSGDSVVVSGRVAMLTGLPVGQAQVDIRIEQVQLWWRRVTAVSSSIASAKTDDSGAFKIKCSTADLAKNNLYVANILATSLTAETAEASTMFVLGKDLAIMSEINTPQNMDLGKLSVKAQTLTGRGAQVAAKWQLLSDSTLVAGGDCLIDSIGTKIDFTGVRAGDYEIKFIPNDTARCEALKFKLKLYSVERNDVPASMKLFVADTQVEATPDGKFSYQYAVGRNSHVMIFATNKSGIYNVDSQMSEAGFTTLKGKLPRGCREAKITLVVLHEGDFVHKQITVNIPDEKRLTIKIESWRDKLVPGSHETWTFTLGRADGSPIDGAMVATMYNRALDLIDGSLMPNIMPNSLMLSENFTNPSPSNRFVEASTINSYRHFRGYRNRDAINVEAPDYLYVPSFYMTRYDVARNSGVLYKNMTMMAAPTVVHDMDGSAGAKEAESDAAIEETSGSGDFEYREGEVLQAIWQPDLSFNSDGTATISFDVPNANTSWSFHAWAWSKALRSANLIKNAITTKPIMVQPNLPRYLREGDKAELNATIFNNSDSTQTVETTIEIFNPSDGSILSSSTVRSVVKAACTAIVSIETVAPVGGSAIGYRVKSSTDQFADGEQQLLPILSASNVVVESETFYLTAEKDKFTTCLPTDTASVATLQYCQNPVWDVVKVLPALYTCERMTSIGAANALFGALTAKGLASRYPEIRSTIDLWVANPADSALMSKLYKNEDLKIALLKQTPWQGYAEVKSNNMQRLALTFDEKYVDDIVKNTIERLSKLQNADGGLMWSEWSKDSNRWATMSALTTVGHLNDFGYMPTDNKLQNIVDRAFRYIDEHTEDYEYSYTLLYSLYPDRKPSTLEGEQAIKSTVQDLLKKRNKLNTAAKAQAALILHANGYNKVARQLIASLRQYEVKSPQVGISFPSVASVATYSTILKAFAAIDPHEAELDAMRQWLTLKTQVTDDFGLSNPTQLISAILSSGSRWTSLDNKSTISLGGTPLEVSEVEIATGTFSQCLTPKYAGKELSIVRPADSSLSYGSITKIQAKPIDEIEAYGNDEISIMKRMLVERNGEWVETSTPTFGEQVRVQLMIKASRNLEYVTINDERPAAFEPLPSEQLPRFVYSGGLRAYREMNDAQTHLFITYLPRGTYYLSYDMTATFAGEFASGIATIQSQYAPEIVAHSNGCRLMVK